MKFENKVSKLNLDRSTESLLGSQAIHTQAKAVTKYWSDIHLIDDLKLDWRRVTPCNIKPFPIISPVHNTCVSASYLSTWYVLNYVYSTLLCKHCLENTYHTSHGYSWPSDVDEAMKLRLCTGSWNTHLGLIQPIGCSNRLLISVKLMNNPTTKQQNLLKTR